MIFGRGTRGAGKALRRAARVADRVTDPGEALRIRVDALNSFVANAGRDEAFRHRDDVSGVLRDVAEVDPEKAAFLLAILLRQAPAGVTPDVDRAVLRAWAHTAGPLAGVAWDSLDNAAPGFAKRLAGALEAAAADRLSPAFRATAVDRLVDELGSLTCASWSRTVPEEAAELLRLLGMVAPEHAPADWLCVVGDQCVDWENLEEAEEWHRAAAAMGSVPARHRVAYLGSSAGSRLLGEGDLTAALTKFEAAVALEPDPEYLTLLSLTRLLIDPSFDETHLRDLPSELRDFWIGVAAVLSGDHDHARTSLRRASGQPAAVLRAAMDGDDTMLAGYARNLRDRHGAGWAGHSVVGADPLVVAAARADQGLLADLFAETPELSGPALDLAVHAVLTAAARSAAAGDATDAVNRLGLAERMLDGAVVIAGGEPTRLRAVAGRLRSWLDKVVSPDARAYASLVKAGERQPWTEAARRIWVGGGAETEWLHHHLAVVHHSAAFDLEAEGSPNAFVHWKAALDLWARIEQDDGFWARMHRQLDEAMGVPVAREVVDAVRRRLCRELLAPQVALAGRYRVTDPERAARHVRLITESGFPAETIAALRWQLVKVVIARLPKVVDADRHAATIETLASWVTVDPSNVELLRAVLRFSRMALEPLWAMGADPAVYEQLGRQLERVAELVDPALASQPSMKDRMLAAEVARYEFWLGLRDVGRAAQEWRSGKGFARHDLVLVLGGESVLHFQRAVELDPALVIDRYYRRVGELWLAAARLVGLSTVHRWSPGHPAEWRMVARCLQRAMDVGPPNAEADSLLDKLIAGPGEGADEVRNQLDRLLGAPVEFQPGLRYWVGLAALRLAEAADRRDEAAARRAVHHLEHVIATEPMILQHKDFAGVREAVRRARAITDHREPEPPEEDAEGKPDLPAGAVVRGLRRAGRLVAQVLEETGRQVRAGITTDDLDQFAHRLMTSLGVESSLHWHGKFSGYVYTSVNEPIWDGSPDDTVLRSGDLITLSVALNVDGVHAAAARTVSVGPLAEKVELLIRRAEEALQLGIRAVRPGRQPGVVSTVIEAYARRFGYGMVHGACEYDIGTELMTTLIMPSRNGPMATTMIEPGMAYTIALMLTLGRTGSELDEDGWTDGTADGLPAAAGCAHTVLVSESGAEILT